MKYCGYCGAKLKDDMVFCSACGRQQTQKESVTKKEEDTSRLANLSHKFSVFGLLMLYPLCVVGIILALVDRLEHKQSRKGFWFGVVGVIVWLSLACCLSSGAWGI